MIKQVRKKIVSSISNVELPDQFEWNKWLRHPSQEYHIISSIPVKLIKNDEWNKKIPPASVKKAEIISFPKIKLYKGNKKLVFPSPKINRIFFGLGNSKLKEIKIFDPSKIKFKYVFKTIFEKKGEVYYKTINNEQEESLKVSPDSSARDFNFKLSPTKQINLKNIPSKIKKINHEIDLPEITDQLKNIKPKIFNIDLLNLDKIVSADSAKNYKVEFSPVKKVPKIFKARIFKVDELMNELNESGRSISNNISVINFLHKLPRILKIKLPSISDLKSSSYLIKNVQLNDSKIKKEDFKKLNNPEIFEESFNIFDENNDELLNPLILDKLYDDNIKNLLEPEYKVDENELTEMIDHLTDFQKKGVQFLTESPAALLADELGLGKTQQAVSGLKILFKKRDIKTALIICDDKEIGSLELSGKLNKPLGWLGHLLFYSPEISFTQISGKKEDKKSVWKKSSSVFITSYATLQKEIETEAVKKENLAKFDCVIFDEAQHLVKEYHKFSGIFSNAKFLWFLSGFPFSQIKDELDILYKNQNIPSLRRTKTDVYSEYSSPVRTEYWLEMDNEQTEEFNAALKNGQKQVSDLIKSGNPYRFQANIFFLLHQLNQIGNFSSKKDSSPKTELLLEHLNIISKNQQKVVIFSQYDKFGTQRLEQILQNHNFRYVRYIGGMSAGAMETALKSFNNNKKITVLLASLKASGIQFKLTDVPYVIHFDQWWNPASLWQTEERIYSHDSKNIAENLSSLSYLTRNPVEERLREILFEKGLYNKNLVETLSSEIIYNFINMDDWMYILGINKDRETASINKDIQSAADKVLYFNPNELSEVSKSLFSRLGYKKLLIKPEKNSENISIYGSLPKNGNEIKMAAKCITSNTIDKELIRNFVESSGSHNERLFLITTSSSNNYHFNNLNDKLAIINGDFLAKYLVQFNLI